MLPFIGRPWKTKTRTQSSEHGVVAGGKHVDLSGCLFVERHVRLLRRPEVVKQDSQLAGDRNNGLAPGLLATSSGQMETPLSKCRVLPMWLEHSISRLRRYALPAWVMPSLRGSSESSPINDFSVLVEGAVMPPDVAKVDADRHLNLGLSAWDFSDEVLRWLLHGNSLLLLRRTCSSHLLISVWETPYGFVVAISYSWEP
jgi:hypothetical protein